MARAALDNLKAAGIEQPQRADGTPVPIPNTADTATQRTSVQELEKMGVIRTRRWPAEAPRGAVSRGRRVLSRSGVPRKDASRNSVRRRASCSMQPQAHHRAGVGRSSRAGHPQVSAARLGEGLSEWQLICLTHNMLRFGAAPCGVGAS